MATTKEEREGESVGRASDEDIGRIRTVIWRLIEIHLKRSLS